MSQYTKKLKRKIKKLKETNEQLVGFPSIPLESPVERRLREENARLREQLRHAYYGYDREHNFSNPRFNRYRLTVTEAKIKTVSPSLLHEEDYSDEQIVYVRYDNNSQELVELRKIVEGDHPYAGSIRAILSRQNPSAWERAARRLYPRRRTGEAPDSTGNLEIERARERIVTSMGIPNSVLGGSDDITSEERNEKAMYLLKEKIGDALYKNLMDYGYFNVEGKEGTYRFYKSDKVELIQICKFLGNKKRKLVWSLCIESKVRDMPIGDVILARYLQLKSDESRFLKTANFRSVSTDDEYRENNGCYEIMEITSFGDNTRRFQRANLV